MNQPRNSTDASDWTLTPGDLPQMDRIQQDARLSGMEENPVFRWILLRARRSRVYPWGIIALIPCYYLTASLMLGALYDALPAQWSPAAAILMGLLFLPTVFQIRRLPVFADWGFGKYWGPLLHENLLQELGQAGVSPASAALGCLGSLNTPSFMKAIHRTAIGFTVGAGIAVLLFSNLLTSDGAKLGMFFLSFQLGYLSHLGMFGRQVLLHRYTDFFASEARAMRSGVRQKMSMADWMGLLVVAWIGLVLLGALTLALNSIMMGAMAQVHGPVFLAAAVPGFVAGHVQGTIARADEFQNVRMLEDAFRLLLEPRD